MKNILGAGLILLAISASSFANGNEPVPAPRDVPPVLGMAKAGASAAGDNPEWTIELTLPKITWEVIGDVVPKRSWPELSVDVESTRRTLKFGGPSQLSPSRVVNLEGEELSRAEIAKRLANETPVLVAVSGKLPDPYFLQLTKSDALIIILNARDDAPAPEFLPAKK